MRKTKIYPSTYAKGDRLRQENFEITEYEDTGCEISPKCVECPLPQCKHDDQNWFRSYRKLYARRDLLHRLSDNTDINYKELAIQYNLTAATISKLHCRVLAGQIDLNVIDILFTTYNGHDVPGIKPGRN